MQHTFSSLRSAVLFASLTVLGCSGTLDEDAAGELETGAEGLSGEVALGNQLKLTLDAKLRAEPKQNGAVLAEVPVSTVVTALETTATDGYYRVLHQAVPGWIRGSALRRVSIIPLQASISVAGGLTLPLDGTPTEVTVTATGAQPTKVSLSRNGVVIHEWTEPTRSNENTFSYVMSWCVSSACMGEATGLQKLNAALTLDDGSVKEAAVNVLVQSEPVTPPSSSVQATLTVEGGTTLPVNGSSTRVTVAVIGAKPLKVDLAKNGVPLHSWTQPTNTSGNTFSYVMNWCITFQCWQAVIGLHVLSATVTLPDGSVEKVSVVINVLDVATPSPAPSPSPTPAPSNPLPGDPPSNPAPTLPSSATPVPALVTDLASYPEPLAPAMPAMGSTSVDPTFGTTVLRVTDASILGYGTRGIIATASTRPVFNKDNTRMLVLGTTLDGTSDPFLLDFDAQAFTVGNARRAQDAHMLAADSVWSGVDADVIYAHDFPSPQLWAYRLSTSSWSLVADLSSFTDGNAISQMFVSRDDDIFTFSLSTTGVGFVAWSRTRGLLLKKYDSRVEEVQVDKSGHYLLWGGAGQGGIYDLRTGVEVGTSQVGHRDLGWETAFGLLTNEMSLMPTLGTPSTTQPILPHSPYLGDAHFSLNADNENWGVGGFYDHSDFTPYESGTVRQELAQYALDGSNRIRRLVHHHAKYTKVGEAPNPSISRDGRFIAFSSNWGLPGGRMDVYVVRVPPAP